MGPGDAAAAIGRHLAERLGLDPDAPDAPALLRRSSRAPADMVDVEVEVDPWALGAAFERAQSPGDRRTHGVHYTPPAVARALATLVVDDPEVVVCDPAVGGAAFLLAAAEALHTAGIERREVVHERVWGIDVDPAAVEVAKAALALWASVDGVWHSPPDDHLAVGDTLELGPRAFGGRRFDVVVGNPPFQSQLRSTTARSAAQSRALRERWGVDAGPYADAAAWFMIAALSLVRDGGTLSLIQPESTLVAADSAAIRRHVLAKGSITGLWMGGREIFDADVRVCAPVVRLGAAQGPVSRWVGVDVDPAPATTVEPDPASWGGLVADLLGVPPVTVHGPSVADMAEATAGFRDEFYGLAAHTFDAPEGDVAAPLITVGMIDPLRNRWGSRSFRFAGRSWLRPAVDLDSLGSSSARLAAWVRDRRVPKVLVATQTRVLEVIVDPTGDLVPCTPTLAVTTDPSRLWHLAAALSSPVATAVALSRHGGAALSADTLKLSARQVLALPLPTDGEAWDGGAMAARTAAEAASAGDPPAWRQAIERLGEEMVRAYAIADADALAEWWRARLPDWR